MTYSDAYSAAAAVLSGAEDEPCGDHGARCGETAQQSLDDDLPVVVGFSYDPWTDEKTSEFEVPEELLYICRRAP